MSLAEVRLQEGESIENALRRFKRKVQTEDIIEGSEAPLLLPEAGSEAEGEASFGATACPKEDSQRGTKFESLEPLLSSSGLPS